MGDISKIRVVPISWRAAPVCLMAVSIILGVAHISCKAFGVLVRIIFVVCREHLLGTGGGGILSVRQKGWAMAPMAPPGYAPPGFIYTECK